jgi:hypothetical protein
MVANVSCSSLFVHFVPAGRFDFAFISRFVLGAIRREAKFGIANSAARHTTSVGISIDSLEVARRCFVKFEIGVVAKVDTTGSAGMEFLLDSLALVFLELRFMTIVAAFL